MFMRSLIIAAGVAFFAMAQTAKAVPFQVSWTYPTFDETFSQTADIVVNGTATDDNAPIANTDVIVRILNRASGVTMDSIIAETDENGEFQGTLDIEGEWAPGEAKIQVLHDNFVIGDRTTTIEDDD